ncbi:MAG: TetR family transcriptional regulator [Solirubrobacterales bacterium]
MSPRTPKTKTPRTGRRPGTSSTQEQILEAARKLFLERGYQDATMRAIAKEAGVDASLIVHFFGNKLTLFAEAVQWPFDPEVEMPKLLADGRGKLGRNLVSLLLRIWEEQGSRSPVLTLLGAAVSDPEAAEMMGEFVRHPLYAPLLERLGSDQPELRANLLASQLVGLGLARYVLKFEPLASAKPSQVADWIGPNIQRYLTGKLD